jgi:hypothetical protein
MKGTRTDVIGQRVAMPEMAVHHGCFLFGAKDTSAQNSVHEEAV